MRLKTYPKLWLLLAIPIAAVALWRQPPPQDAHAQIVALLEQGRQDLETHRSGAAVALLAPDFHDASGMNRDQIRLALIQALRGLPNLRLHLDRVDSQVLGDQAHVSVRISLTTQAPGEAPHSQTFPVEMEMQRRPGHRFLIFPDRQWRITSASGWQPSDSDFPW